MRTDSLCVKALGCSALQAWHLSCFKYCVIKILGLVPLGS